MTPIEEAKIEPPKTEQPATQAAEQPQKSEPRRLAAWMQIWSPIILNALFLIVVMGHAFYFQMQWDAMKTGLKETRISREVDNRAYVFLNFIQFENTIDSGKPLKVSYKFENTGKTPALNVATSVNMGVDEIGLSEQTVQGTAAMNAQLPALAKQGYWVEEKAVLPPGMPFRGVAGAVTLQPDELLMLKKGQHFHLWGTIAYCDIFGKRWETEFCLYNISTDSVEFGFCPSHNAYTEKPAEGKCRNPD